jgi:hypothetical protein
MIMAGEWVAWYIGNQFSYLNYEIIRHGDIFSERFLCKCISMWVLGESVLAVSDIWGDKYELKV